MANFSKLTDMAAWFRSFQFKDDDVNCLISARKGQGKSTLGLLLMKLHLLLYMRVCPACGWESLGVKEKVDGQLAWITPKVCGKCGHELTTIKFSMELWKTWLRKYVAYDVADFLDKLFSLEFFSPLFADEAVRFAMGEDWNKYESKEAKRAIAQIRTKHLIVYMAIPKFNWLDRKYRDDMSTCWLRIMEKGRVDVFRPDLGECEDAYHLKELKEAMGTYFYDDPNMSRILSKIQRHPCYYDTFQFPPLSDEEYEAYLEIRNEFTLKRKQEDSVDSREVGKFVVYNLINQWPALQAAVAASRFGRPTCQILAENVFCNPAENNKTLVGINTLNTWGNDVKHTMKAKEKIGEKT